MQAVYTVAVAWIAHSHLGTNATLSASQSSIEQSDLGVNALFKVFLNSSFFLFVSLFHVNIKKKNSET